MSRRGATKLHLIKRALIAKYTKTVFRVNNPSKEAQAGFHFSSFNRPLLELKRFLIMFSETLKYLQGPRLQL